MFCSSMKYSYWLFNISVHLAFKHSQQAPHIFLYHLWDKWNNVLSTEFTFSVLLPFSWKNHQPKSGFSWYIWKQASYYNLADFEAKSYTYQNEISPTMAQWYGLLCHAMKMVINSLTPWSSNNSSKSVNSEHGMDQVYEPFLKKCSQSMQ